MSKLRSLLLFAVLAPLMAIASPGRADWLDDARQGGHVIVIRHGATFSNQADTDPLNIKNVAAQRQLNDQGRALAKKTGEAMRSLKIPVGSVVTSMFQRAVDTGTLLGFGEVTSTFDVTEGGLVVTPDENNRRAEAFRKLAATPPPAGSNVVIVSHKPNIMDAFGKDWFDVREGEASVFKPDGQGGYKPVVRVQAAEWDALVKARP
jgi:broad specificity phosphatase PhoE